MYSLYIIHGFFMAPSKHLAGRRPLRVRARPGKTMGEKTQEPSWKVDESWTFWLNNLVLV